MAMDSSARYLTNYQAHEQGFGLINVGAAWDLLKTNLKKQDIDSAVPVNSKLSGFLATPGIGRGIYEREGRHAGDAAFTRTYTFTKSDGGSGSYNLSWRGNDGSFSLPAGQTTLSIGSKGSATLTITVRPAAASGVSSALLLLDDPKTAGIEYATMNTIITSIKLDASNNYTGTVSASASKFQAGQPKAFFDVPLGATAMRMTLSVTNNGRVNATALHPYGVPLTAASQAIGFTTGPASDSRVLTTGPTAGVWEVVTAASRAAVPDNSTYTITFEAFKVTLSPNPLIQDPTTIGTPYTKTFTVTNDFAAVNTVQTVGATLSSVRTIDGSINEGGAQQTYEIIVPAGTTSLTASIGAASDPGADLDLYLFNCTTGTCVQAGAGTSSTANESVTVSSPAAGRWVALVDPFAVPAGTTTYQYSDSFSKTPAFGTLTTPANAATLRAAGATWTFNVIGTANSAAGTGRFLRGSAQVRLGSSVGPVLGSATVELRNVAP